MKNISSVKISILRFLLTSLLVHFVCNMFSQNAVSTHAGSTQGFADATGTAAKFKAPTGICLSPDGTAIYVADYSGHRIRKIVVATKVVTTVAGNGTTGFLDAGGTAAQFSYPSGICISPDGTTLYVSDYGNSRIRKILLASGAVTTVAGNGSFSYLDHTSGLSAAFNSPTDLVISGDSIIYITDTENHLIRKFNINTTAVTTVAGMVGVAGFQNGIGTNAAFRYPKGLAVSEDGNTLFVADNGNHMIRSIALSTATVNTVAGDGTAGYSDNSVGPLAKLNSPNGVSIVPGNSSLLYVADNANHRIRKIDLTTTSVTTVAGDGSVPPASTFSDNTNGLNAKFFYPTNLKISPDGNDIYITDQGNFRVRKVKTDLSSAGLADDDNNETIQVFPNPSSGSIHVNGLHPETEYTLILTDLTGRELTKKQIRTTTEGSAREELSDIPSGNYLLNFFSGKHSFTEHITLIK